MRYLLPLALVLALPAVSQQADNMWQGKLVDWQCKQIDQSKPCPTSPHTKEFALSGDGGVLLRLDAKGNELAHQELVRTGEFGNTPVTIETYEEQQVEHVMPVKAVHVRPLTHS
ncbi:MAG: hypothetical protein GC160_07400 [Acidobacteria bacterium]|nr:hypothetical protein [Acidobacteriota bacterium]